MLCGCGVNKNAITEEKSSRVNFNFSNRSTPLGVGPSSLVSITCVIFLRVFCIFFFVF